MLNFSFLLSGYINLIYLIIFGFLLLGLGFYGFLVSLNNTLFFLVSNEVFVLGIIFVILGISEMTCDISGEIFSLILLSTAAVETSVVLILILIYYRHTTT